MHSSEKETDYHSFNETSMFINCAPGYIYINKLRYSYCLLCITLNSCTVTKLNYRYC